MFPLSTYEIIGSVVFFLVIGIASAAGIGGGGITMPIIILFFGYSGISAVSMSNFNIFCAAVLRFIVNINQKHPEADKLSVDYDSVLIILPLSLFGTTIGVMVGQMLPPVAIVAMLTLVLLVMAY